MENVGKLEPGASYVYEQADGVTYARKFGDAPDQRFEIGRNYDSKKLFSELQDAKLWSQIHRAAQTNPALQDAIDRVKIIYALSQQDNTVPHHPV